jgi:WD40 repeat protein
MDAASTNPFVGLRPFESDESLLFFGRQEQTLELLQRLHQFNFVGVIGSSGSGKSSIIRAGVIPRLKAGYLVADRDRWAVCIMKPGESPICNLASSILGQLPAGTLTTGELETKIKEVGLSALLEVLQPFWDNNFNLFLLVDQFEELFRFSLNQNDYDRKDEAIEFVNIMLELSKRTDLPVYVTITMRSDFIGDCSQIYGLPEALNQSQYLVPRLSRLQLKTAIESPVRLYRGNIEDNLTTRLLNDVQLVNDELPLLQHALMRMWEREDTAGTVVLGVKDYDAIGGLSEALSNHADEALQGMPESEITITKKIFQALTGIDEKGRKVRRQTRLSELVVLTGTGKEALLAIINRFIRGNKNFLITSNIENKDDLLVDISHESLIRQWSKLSAWVDEEADSSRIYLRLAESTKLKEEKKKDWLAGNELHQAVKWFNTFKPSREWAARYNATYAINIAYLKASEQEEKTLLSRRRRNKRIIYGSVLLVLLMVSAFAIFIFKNNVKNKRQLALNYWKSSQTARSENNFLETLSLIAEATEIDNDPNLVQDLLVDGEAFLPATELQNIYNLPSIINHAAFSPDGKFIIASGNDGNVRVINIATSKINKTIRCKWPVMSAIFNHDGTLILTSGNDKTVRIYNVTTGKEVALFNHDEAVNSAVFSSDEKLILTSCADGNAYTWDVQTGRRTASFKHQAAVTSAAFSNNDKLIVTASNDFTGAIWDVASKKKLAALEHNNEVTSAVFSPGDEWILTACKDSTARLWDVKTKTQLASFNHNNVVTSAEFSPDGKQALTGCADKSARLWNVETTKQVGTAMKHEGQVYTAAFSADGKWLLSGGADKTIRLWSVAPKQKTTNQIVVRHNSIVTGCMFSPDGTKFLTASYDSSAVLWDAATGKQLFVMRHNSLVSSAAFNSNGSLIITSGFDSTIRTWDAVAYKQTSSILYDDALYTAAFSPDDKFILTVGKDKIIAIWNAAGGARLYAATNDVTFKKAVFNPDGRRVLLSGGDNSAIILDSILKPTTAKFTQDNLVNNAAFNNDGTQVLTAGWDMTARLWDALTAKQIGSDMKHSNYVNSAHFSNNSRWMITAGWDSAAHLWSRITLKELGASMLHQKVVTNAVFNPDGTRVLTCGYDSTARIWQIEGDLDLPAPLFKLQANATTGVEYNLERSETQCLSKKSWKSLYDDYAKQASGHFKTCKYPQYNLWHRLHPVDGEK